MEGDVVSLIMVTACVIVSMTYARFASSSVRPGKLRLLALLPVIILLPCLPLHFSSIQLRSASALFLVWLSVFKLLLLASGSQGPLSPSLPLPTFIAIASLPIDVKLNKSTPASDDNGDNHDDILNIIPSCIIRALILALLLHLYQYKSHMPFYLLHALHITHFYLILWLLLTVTAFLAGSFFGLDLQPQFDAPLKSTSVQDFWGKRWNLRCTGILRLSVYNPVRSRLGTETGIMAAFLVSGLMHEVLWCYITLEAPTSAEVSCFFVLQGLCTVVEVRMKKAGRWWPHPPLTVLLFVAGTASWLMLAAWRRAGSYDKFAEDMTAAARFVVDGGRVVLLRLLDAAPTKN